MDSISQHTRFKYVTLLAYLLNYLLTYLLTYAEITGLMVSH